MIDRHRSRGLPPVIDADVLARAGVSDSLIPRTLQSMKVLDLLTEDGRPSEVFEGIRLAPTHEYEQRLAQWLNAAYADALTYVDPATDDEVAIRDAFRKYIPTGQQGRMVTLFMGLFTAAGVMPQRQKSQVPAKPKNATPRLGAIKARAPSPTPPTKNPPMVTNPSGVGQASGLPAALAGLLATLPPEGGSWPQERRDKFLNTFAVVLDYTYPVGNPPAEKDTADSQ
ncbi:DUF5343 domain-containing protein [Erythrobacter sp. NFXS35]